MTRLFLTGFLFPSVCLCVGACQPAADQPTTIANVAIDSPPPGAAPHLVVSGPPAWETPLRWQIHDSFVTVGGEVQPVHGHKSKRVVIPVTLTNTDGSTVTLHFLVDTGADRTIINTAKVHADLKGARPEQASGVGGVQQMFVTTVPKLMVGDMIQENAEVAFTKMPVDEDGLLGQDFLRHYAVTIDYRRGIFRLERADLKDRKESAAH